VCCNLFLAKSELVDRRPLVACVSGDTLCADCCKECRKRPGGKCPTCGDDLLTTLVPNKTLMELIENYSSLLEISFKEIEMQQECFARGAFGQVYKATWCKENVVKNVVIKVIMADSEAEKRAVKDEANLTLRLSHANVIELFGITRVKGNRFGIVMEEAVHGSLDKCIGKIDHGQLTKIALDIIDGLIYVHSQRVMHRDIKPQNILMFGRKDDMIPKIADFGVSKVIETAIKTRTKVGQDLYMAPEVKMFGRYGFPADIFSLAIMLFEMFNEQLLSNSSAVVQQFIFGVHAGRFGTIPASCKVPLYLRDVIKRGWNESPESRPELSEYSSILQG